MGTSETIESEIGWMWSSSYMEKGNESRNGSERNERRVSFLSQHPFLFCFSARVSCRGGRRHVPLMVACCRAEDDPPPPPWRDSGNKMEGSTMYRKRKK